MLVFFFMFCFFFSVFSKQLEREKQIWRGIRLEQIEEEGLKEDLCCPCEMKKAIVDYQTKHSWHSEAWCLSRPSGSSC